MLFFAMTIATTTMRRDSTNLWSDTECWTWLLYDKCRNDSRIFIQKWIRIEFRQNTSEIRGKDPAVHVSIHHYYCYDHSYSCKLYLVRDVVDSLLGSSEISPWFWETFREYQVRCSRVPLLLCCLSKIQHSAGRQNNHHTFPCTGHNSCIFHFQCKSYTICVICWWDEYFH